MNFSPSSSLIPNNVCRFSLIFATFDILQASMASTTTPTVQRIVEYIPIFIKEKKKSKINHGGLQCTMLI